MVLWSLRRLTPFVGAPTVNAAPSGEPASYLPIVMRAPTPTPIPTPCNTSVGVLTNGDFERGLEHWVSSGNPQITDARAREGTHSALLGGRDSAEDVLLQGAAMPHWAESGALYLSVFMKSSDSTTDRRDSLSAIVFDDQQPLASAVVANISPRDDWLDLRIPIPNAVNYRSKSLIVFIRGSTDGAAPTTWYVDNVDLRFGCGATLAGAYSASPDAFIEPAPPELVARAAETIRALRAAGAMDFGEH